LSKQHKNPTLSDLCDLVSGQKTGHSSVRFTGIAAIDSAKETEIGVLVEQDYLQKVATTRAAALITSKELAAELPSDLCCITVANPRKAVADLLKFFQVKQEELIGIHPTAVVSADIQAGDGFYAGPYVVVESGVTVGRRVKLHPHVVIQRGSLVGDDVVIHSHSVVHAHVRIGNRVIIQSGSRIGADGFGYAKSRSGMVKITHQGGCVLADDVEVGANTCIDRGSLADTEIHRGVKIDNLVHIAHNVVIGENSLIAAQVGIAGSTKVGAETMWGGQSGAAGHLEIGARTEIAAKAGVAEDSEPNSKLAGFPARELKTFLKGQAHLDRIEQLKARISELEKKLKGRGERN